MWTKAGVVMPGNTRAHAQSPIGTPSIRATATAKIAHSDPSERDTCVFSAISTYTDKRHSPYVSTCSLSNEPLARFRVHLRA